MIRRNRLSIAALAAVLLSVPTISRCADALEALTAHARPVASAAGEELGVARLATIMADSPLPDSALTSHWAAQIARLWADYVSIVRLYQEPDTTASLDYDRLLQAARYYPALEVMRYRDSVVLADIEPTVESVRAYFERAEPLTRLDVRRIRLGVPEEAPDAIRDSLYAEARRLRERVAAGADFIEVARAASDEPGGARGQLLAYQGHEDFPPAADSVVFDLRPGQVSLVIATGEQMVFYRVERRHAPDFEDVKDIVRERMTGRRRADRLSATADSLLMNSRRVVADGAERIARLVASSPGMSAGRVAGSLRLVRYDGGEFTVAELRRLMLARPDLRRRFATSDDEQMGLDLYHLAGDELLMQAADRSGVKLTEEERIDLREGIAGQLDDIAGRLNVSHVLVVNPRFNVEAEGRRFLTSVLERGTPVPMAAEFRMVLDQRFPSRVDLRSAEAAARLAREQRGQGASAAAATDSTTDDEAE